MSKVYIAGKINGLDNYREIFKAAEEKLIAEGNVVMNPATLPEGFEYEVYLPICLLMLQACDKVYMLNNWKTSKGAKVELEYAKAQGKEIIYQESGIKFFEFNGEFEYYALIKARNEEEAIKEYAECVEGDLEEYNENYKDCKPDEVPKEYAKEKYIKSLLDQGEEPEKTAEDFSKDFDKYLEREEVDIVLVDAELC